MVSVSGALRIGAGGRDPYCRDFSRGCALVPCGLFAHWLRLCLYAQIGKEDTMKIVVVKSPKFLKGILRMIFGMKE